MLSACKLHGQSHTALHQKPESPAGAAGPARPPGRRLDLLHAWAVSAECVVQNQALLPSTPHGVTVPDWGKVTTCFLLIPERATGSCHFRVITLAVDIREVNHAEGKSLY